MKVSLRDHAPPSRRFSARPAGAPFARRLAMMDKAPCSAPPMAQLTILYDGGCPLCLREVRFLRGRDPRGDRLGFVDIDASDYNPAGHGGIDYRAAMARIHGITADGQVLRDVEVLPGPTAWWGWAGSMPRAAGPCWDPPSMASTGSGPEPACSSPVAPTSRRSAGPAPSVATLILVLSITAIAIAAGSYRCSPHHP